jgi:hypothetical protein
MESSAWISLKNIKDASGGRLVLLIGLILALRGGGEKEAPWRTRPGIGDEFYMNLFSSSMANPK